MAYLQAPIIGTGTLNDPYRAAVADYGTSVARIPSGPAGRPPNTCLVWVPDRLLASIPAILRVRVADIEARQEIRASGLNPDVMERNQ